MFPIMGYGGGKRAVAQLQNYSSTRCWLGVMLLAMMASTER